VIRRRGSAVAAFLLTLGVLSGCGGGGDDGNEPDGDDGPSPTAETTPAEEPYLPVPEGVELTEPGTDLTVGDPAMIAWQPRQNLIGVLDVAVTRLEKTTFAESFEGWDVKQEQKQKLRPYFVHATVANRGKTNLSGRLVPLYAEDSTDTLLEPTEFKDGTFKPCPGGTLPKGFSTNDTTEVCMVYLLGDGLNLTGITFRPTSTFDPITWTGKIQRIEKPGKKKQKKGNGGNNAG
jgi:hypothetical protein